MKPRRFNTPAAQKNKASQEELFLAAVERGDRQAAAALLLADRKLAHAKRERDTHGLLSSYTALHIAAEKGHPGIAEDLVQAGAQVDAQDYVGQTPLMLAAMFDKPELVKFLLSKNAKADHAASEGYTALMYAARNAAFEPARLLIAHKPSIINDQSEIGSTALHFATYAEKEADARKMIQMLMDRGIDHTLQDDAGDTAAANARLEGKRAIALFIEDYAEQIEQEKERAAQKRARQLAHIGESFGTGTGRPIAAPETATFTRKNKPPGLKLP